MMKTITKKTAGWLVMAATRTRQVLTLTAAAAVMSIATASCSSEDGLAEEPVQPVEKTDAVKKYTLTVVASKGGASREQNGTRFSSAEAQPALGEAKGGDATTRALSLSSDGKMLSATWKAGEEVKVYKVTVINPGTMEEQASESLVGTLTAQSSGATTTLSGSFDEGYTPHEGDLLRLKFNDKPDYSNQEGTLDYIATHCDYALAEITIASVDESGNVTANGTAEFENQQAIVKFSLKESDGNNGTTSLPVMSLTVKVGKSTTYNVKPVTPASEIYVAIQRTSEKDIEMTALNDAADGYSYKKSGVTFNKGQYYAISVKMTENHPYEYLVDLSELHFDDYYVPDSTILTGTLSSGCKITIADGAIVKLKNVTIPGGANYDSNLYAGITCQGNATIKISGTNSVKGYHRNYPGIQAGGAGTTLTIEGSGKLTATCGGGGTDEHGAGIGGAQGEEVGDIVITGGEITATGGSGAGIGSGHYGKCGNITISGGTIRATSNGQGAGIGAGAGQQSSVASCGNIIISGGTVTATGGRGGAGIGSGNCGDGNNGSSCGNITITGGAITANGGTRTAGQYKYGAAGIGTGCQTNCGSITISGTANGTATHGENNNTNSSATCYDIGTGYIGHLKNGCTISVAAGTISGSYPQ